MVYHAAHVGLAVTGNSWPYLFKAFFVDDNNHADDLLFFVANLEHVAQRDPAGLLQVYRRGSETRPMPPITGKEFDWEESTCLNLLMQQVNGSRSDLLLSGLHTVPRRRVGLESHVCGVMTSLLLAETIPNPGKGPVGPLQLPPHRCCRLCDLGFGLTRWPWHS